MSQKEETSENFRITLRVEGIVQGVFFRVTTRQQARQLGLSGWVRNAPDDAVEVVAEGEKSALERLVNWCYQGPEGAVVSHVEVKWEPYRGEYQDFFITY